MNQEKKPTETKSESTSENQERRKREAQRLRELTKQEFYNELAHALSVYLNNKNINLLNLKPEPFVKKVYDAFKIIYPENPRSKLIDFIIDRTASEEMIGVILENYVDEVARILNEQNDASSGTENADSEEATPTQPESELTREVPQDEDGWEEEQTEQRRTGNTGRPGHLRAQLRRKNPRKNLSPVTIDVTPIVVKETDSEKGNIKEQNISGVDADTKTNTKTKSERSDLDARGKVGERKVLAGITNTINVDRQDDLGSLPTWRDTSTPESRTNNLPALPDLSSSRSLMQDQNIPNVSNVSNVPDATMMERMYKYSIENLGTHIHQLKKEEEEQQKQVYLHEEEYQKAQEIVEQAQEKIEEFKEQLRTFATADEVNDYYVNIAKKELTEHKASEAESLKQLQKEQENLEKIKKKKEEAIQQRAGLLASTRSSSPETQSIPSTSERSGSGEVGGNQEAEIQVEQEQVALDNLVKAREEYVRSGLELKELGEEQNTYQNALKQYMRVIANRHDNNLSSEERSENMYRLIRVQERIEIENERNKQEAETLLGRNKQELYNRIRQFRDMIQNHPIRSMAIAAGLSIGGGMALGTAGVSALGIAAFTGATSTFISSQRFFGQYKIAIEQEDDQKLSSELESVKDLNKDWGSFMEFLDEKAETVHEAVQERSRKLRAKAWRAFGKGVAMTVLGKIAGFTAITASNESGFGDFVSKSLTDYASFDTTSSDEHIQLIGSEEGEAGTGAGAEGETETEGTGAGAGTGTGAEGEGIIKKALTVNTEQPLTIASGSSPWQTVRDAITQQLKELNVSLGASEVLTESQMADMSEKATHKTITEFLSSQFNGENPDPFFHGIDTSSGQIHDFVVLPDTEMEFDNNGVLTSIETTPSGVTISFIKDVLGDESGTRALWGDVKRLTLTECRDKYPDIAERITTLTDSLNNYFPDNLVDSLEEQDSIGKLFVKLGKFYAENKWGDL